MKNHRKWPVTGVAFTMSVMLDAPQQWLFNLHLHMISSSGLMGSGRGPERESEQRRFADTTNEMN